jgi:DNA-binding winged helix-turn-helix (wHTH) protein
VADRATSGRTHAVAGGGNQTVVIRYRFGDFTVSPRRRLLLREGREVRLIPRYFDLLVLLVERRHEAVHRRDIFDGVWTDVIVSDSALSQAVRTLRRTLGDDSRDPRFIRTVARHGYRFVFADLIAEEDDGVWPEPAAVSQPHTVEAPEAVAAPPADGYEQLLDRLTRAGGTEEDRREAAELLHALGTSAALRRLGTRPGHAAARALLRDVRWDAPAAGEVPVLGAPAPFAVARELLRLRLRRAARIAARRWAGAAAGGGLAGVVAGAAGGLILAAAPESAATVEIAPVLAVIGGACGAVGGAGVGAGLSFAEASARSQRAVALVSAAALGGGMVGAAVQWLVRSTLAALVGVDVEIGGGLEGLVIGAAAGAGYAIATRNTDGGMAAPRGRSRLRAALITAVICGLAGVALTLTGRPLAGGTIHAIADAADGSRATLAPLGRLIGEPDFGPFSRALLALGEGAMFGLGLAYGLMRRPRPTGP